MSNNDDFKELSSLSELDFHEEQPEPEEERDFQAPVAHQKGTDLKAKEQNQVDDYNYVRKVYLNMIESGQISLEVAINELRASGHPRAAEVVGGLIKQIADVSGQLLDINDKASGEKKQPESQTNIQNNFYGSPNDLLEQIEKEEQEKANAKASEEFPTVEKD